jgi:hypothetical protein
MCTVLYCTVLYCTVLYCTVLYCTVLHCTLLCCTLMYCTALYCIVLYCTVLYCTVLYCTVLYCIVLPVTFSNTFDFHEAVYCNTIKKVTNNTQIYRLIYYFQSALHVSGDVFTHHQEHLTVFTLSGNIHPSCCWRLPADSNLGEY